MPSDATAAEYDLLLTAYAQREDLTWADDSYPVDKPVFSSPHVHVRVNREAAGGENGAEVDGKPGADTYRPWFFDMEDLNRILRRAVAIEDAVEQVSGVRAVHAYPRTASIVIWYSPKRCERSELFTAIETAAGVARELVPVRTPRSADIANADVLRMTVGGLALACETDAQAAQAAAHILSLLLRQLGRDALTTLDARQLRACTARLRELRARAADDLVREHADAALEQLRLLGAALIFPASERRGLEIRMP